MKKRLFIPLLLLLAACGPKKETVIEWPALKALDAEVEELDGLLAADPNPAAMEEHMPHVQMALENFLHSDIPANAKNRDLVEQKIEEMRKLAEEVDIGSDVLPALHPLVVSLMEEAGMPHVHDEDHDHKDGDHDHDH
jgi:hypothetical protein